MKTHPAILFTYRFFAWLIAVQAGIVVLPLFYLTLILAANSPWFVPPTILMIIGCVGAWLNPKEKRSRKLDRINLRLLVCGVIGVVVLTALGIAENGNWRQTEWGYTLFFLIPTLQAALCARLCFLRLKRNEGEYDLKAWEITQKTSATPYADSARVPDRSS